MTTTNNFKMGLIYIISPIIRYYPPKRERITFKCCFLAVRADISGCIVMNGTSEGNWGFAIIFGLLDGV